MFLVLIIVIYINRLSRKEIKDEDFLRVLKKALAQRFNIDVVIFVSKKKKHVHLSLKKLPFEFHNFE